MQDVVRHMVGFTGGLFWTGFGLRLFLWFQIVLFWFHIGFLWFETGFRRPYQKEPKRTNLRPPTPPLKANPMPYQFQ